MATVSAFEQFRRDLIKDKDYIASKKVTVILPFYEINPKCRDKKVIAHYSRATADIPNPCLVTPERLRLLVGNKLSI